MKLMGVSIALTYSSVAKILWTMESMFHGSYRNVSHAVMYMRTAHGETVHLTFAYLPGAHCSSYLEARSTRRSGVWELSLGGRRLHVSPKGGGTFNAQSWLLLAYFQHGAAKALVLCQYCVIRFSLGEHSASGC